MTTTNIAQALKLADVLTLVDERYVALLLNV